MAAATWRVARTVAVPRTNGLDFSRCAFEGATNLFGFCSTSVTWVYERFSGDRVFLVPITGNTDCTMGLQNPDCSVSPFNHAIAAGDGELLLDYSTDPPTYMGYGNTHWSIRFACPGTPPQQVPFVSNWFAQEGRTTFTGGRTIMGHVVIDDGELNWAFSYRP
jgi:hypothetical protein